LGEWKEDLIGLRLNEIIFYEFKNVLREGTQSGRRLIKERILLMLDKWIHEIY